MFITLSFYKKKLFMYCKRDVPKKLPFLVCNDGEDKNKFYGGKEMKNFYQ